MKQLILVKQSTSQQLGHLYEHIFCAHIDELFYKNHLFQHLDYHLVGRTLNGGVIYIQLDLYTDAAIRFAQHVPTLAIDFTKENVPTATSQLLAEKQMRLDTTGYNNVVKALLALHEQPWGNIDDLDQMKTIHTDRKSDPFYIVYGKLLPSRILTTNILLDRNFERLRPDLLPLFNQLSRLVNFNFQHRLADKYGYYSDKYEYKSTKQGERLSNFFRVADAHEDLVDLADNLKACLQVVEYLQKHGGFDRMLSELQAISYYNHPQLAPDLERSYIETRALLGSKGWKRIATKDNCDAILKHMTIEVKFGRKKVSQTVL